MSDELPPLPSNPDENGGPDILIATLLVTVLATITVLARIYVRGFVIQNPGWDVSHHALCFLYAA